jgi:hypothetical protein
LGKTYLGVDFIKSRLIFNDGNFLREKDPSPVGIIRKGVFGLMHEGKLLSAVQWYVQPTSTREERTIDRKTSEVDGQ